MKNNYINSLGSTGGASATWHHDMLEAILGLEGGFNSLIGKPSGGDFIVAYQTAGPPGTIRLSGMPSWYPVSTFTVDDIEKIVRYDTTGAYVDTYQREDTLLTYSNPDITITGVTLTATDTFVVYTNVRIPTDSVVEGDVAHDAADSGDPVKTGGRARTSQIGTVANNDRTDAIFNAYGEQVLAGYDWTEQALRIIEQAPLFNHRTIQEISTGDIDTTDIYYYVIPFDTYKNASIQVISVADAAISATLSIYANNDPDANLTVTDGLLASDWIDVSTEIIGVGNLACPAATTTKDIWFLDTNMVAQYYVLVWNVTQAAAADITLDVKIKKTF